MVAALEYLLVSKNERFGGISILVFTHLLYASKFNGLHILTHL